MKPKTYTLKLTRKVKDCPVEECAERVYRALREANVPVAIGYHHDRIKLVLPRPGAEVFVVPRRQAQ